MKLIIDIPNDLYGKYKNDNNIDDIHKWNILSFIRKSIPLDKIRAEIINKSNEPNYLHENENWSVGLEMALEIIDKYKAESEEV